MSHYLSDMVQGLLRLPDDQTFPPDADLSPFYTNWGFSVYRTAYGPSSDRQWQTLVDKIRAQAVAEVKLHSGPDQEHSGDRDDGGDQSALQLLSLFRLDLHSDPATLKDADMDRVRQIYRDAVEGVPMHADRQSCFRLFLLVDDEVLAGAANGESWIKCVQVDYDAADYVPRNTRVGGQRYFGWMKMTTRSLLDLWSSLQSWDLQRIAPPTIGGMHLEVWDGD